MLLLVNIQFTLLRIYICISIWNAWNRSVSLSLSFSYSLDSFINKWIDNSTNHDACVYGWLNVSNVIGSTKITIYLKPFGFSVKQIVSLSNYPSVYFYYKARYFKFGYNRWLCRVLNELMLMPMLTLNKFTKIALATTK